MQNIFRLVKHTLGKKFSGGQQNFGFFFWVTKMCGQKSLGVNICFGQTFSGGYKCLGQIMSGVKIFLESEDLHEICDIQMYKHLVCQLN